MSDWIQREAHPEIAQYYYDLAVEADVPESVSSHIGRCLSCRRQIVRLKAAVLEWQNRAKGRQTPVPRVVDTLDAHFHCLEQAVTCARVRPFLPGLLQPSVELRIPTPVTVHVDQCPRCAVDLEALRMLALDSGQLERLRRLYERKSSRSLLLCRRARPSIAAFSRGALDGIDPEILDHLATCPRCRADVYARRQALLEERSGASEDGCDRIAPADLLDYVMPSAETIDRAGRSDASHVGTCRTCLETIQALHRAIYDVIERPESGVVTVYHTIEEGETVVASPDDPYADYPISVQVVRPKPGRVAVHGGAAAQRETVNPHVRRLLKTAVAAAAVIPLAALFVYTQRDSGTTFAKVMRAFGQARNVRVVGINPNTEDVTYELWVARDLNLAGFLRADRRAVYDLTAKRKADLDSGEIGPIDDVEYDKITGMSRDCLGFNLADVPPDAGWKRVAGDGDREVYELAWIEQTYGGRTLAAKCEVVFDASTLLPGSFCLFRKYFSDTEWKCVSVVQLEYPTEAEMTSVMMSSESALGR